MASDRPCELVVNQLKESGIKVIVWLPDSRMTELWDLISQDGFFRKIQVAKEDEGIGICAGAYAGGLNAALLMANAGLLTCGYPLATLSLMHRIPVFMLVNYRGTLGDHVFFQEYQGITTVSVLESLGVNYHVISTPQQVGVIKESFAYSKYYKRPVAVLLRGEFLDEPGRKSALKRRIPQ